MTSKILPLIAACLSSMKGPFSNYGNEEKILKSLRKNLSGKPFRREKFIREKDILKKSIIVLGFRLQNSSRYQRLILADLILISDYAEDILEYEFKKD